MDGLHLLLLVTLGAFSCSPWISGSDLEVTARPGENITLYCDCKPSTGVYIVWFRNCSHENQPSFVLSLAKFSYQKPSRFEFVRNYFSNSYDLFIMNVSVSDEGLYYCGTEERTVEDDRVISSKTIYNYGNITRITVGSSGLRPDIDPSLQNCSLCWNLLSSLCPLSVLSTLVLLHLVYWIFKKSDKEPHEEPQQTTELDRLNTRGQTTSNMDEDIYSTRVVYRVQRRQTHQ